MRWLQKADAFPFLAKNNDHCQNAQAYYRDWYFHSVSDGSLITSIQSGPNVIKLFTTIIYECPKYAKCLFLSCHTSLVYSL